MSRLFAIDMIRPVMAAHCAVIDTRLERLRAEKGPFPLEIRFEEITAGTEHGLNDAMLALLAGEYKSKGFRVMIDRGRGVFRLDIPALRAAPVPGAPTALRIQAASDVPVRSYFQKRPRNAAPVLITSYVRKHPTKRPADEVPPEEVVHDAVVIPPAPKRARRDRNQ